MALKKKLTISEEITPALLAQVQSLALKAQLLLEGTLAGVHRSPYHGYSSDFYQFKNYNPGDDLRNFDWGVYAKTDRPVIREYHDETNTHLQIVLDNSLSMDFKGNGGASFSKWEVAQLLAATLFYLGYKQRDRYTLMYGSSSVHQPLESQSSAHHLNKIFELLESVEPSGTTDLSGIMSQTAYLRKKRSLTYVLSDLWQETDQVIQSLKFLGGKQYPTFLLHILSPDELHFSTKQALELQDLESSETEVFTSKSALAYYPQKLKVHLNSIQETCHKQNIVYLCINTSTSLTQSLKTILEHTALHRV